MSAPLRRQNTHIDIRAPIASIEDGQEEIRGHLVVIGEITESLNTTTEENCRHPGGYRYWFNAAMNARTVRERRIGFIRDEIRERKRNEREAFRSEIDAILARIDPDLVTPFPDTLPASIEETDVQHARLVRRKELLSTLRSDPDVRDSSGRALSEEQLAALRGRVTKELRRCRGSVQQHWWHARKLAVGDDRPEADDVGYLFSLMAIIDGLVEDGAILSPQSQYIVGRVQRRLNALI